MMEDNITKGMYIKDNVRKEWVTFPYSKSWHNILNQLSCNKKIKKKFLRIFLLPQKKKTNQFFHFGLEFRSPSASWDTGKGASSWHLFIKQLINRKYLEIWKKLPERVFEIFIKGQGQGQTE